MKKHISIFTVVALLFGSMMSSCVQDLEHDCIDPNMITDKDIELNQLFSKCYSTLGLTGQKGPDGSGDIEGMDEGKSSFYRTVNETNEYGCDQLYWIWPDAGVAELRSNSWTSTNIQCRGLYSRCYFDITLCNLFLDNCDNYTEKADAAMKAEVRFIRALNYYYLLDNFGNVPFCLHVETGDPDQIKRADLYDWLTHELEALRTDLAPAWQRKSYYRVDQAAADLLLSRIYLNHEIYLGTADQAVYDKAAKYAKMVIDSPYQLASKYQYLFMGDNDGLSTENDAHREIILPVAQDGLQTRCWGGSQYLIASYSTAGMPSVGTNDRWKSLRAKAQLVQLFCPELKRPYEPTNDAEFKKMYGKYAVTTSTEDASSYDENGFPICIKEMQAACGDDRALFINSMKDADGVLHYCNFWKECKADVFFSGWLIWKFTNNVADPKHVLGDSKLVDMDIPLMRAAEAYFNYAEAVLRGAGEIDGYTPVEAINTIRRRAHAEEISTCNLDYILDERGREFYGEGMRRNDLIRFHKFTGSTYAWEYKGGDILGKTPIEDYRILFPLPLTDVVANSKLTQNPDY